MSRYYVHVAAVLFVSVSATIAQANVTYTDDFNRGDATDLGTAWSNAFGMQSLGISSNMAVSSDADRANVYTAAATNGSSGVTASVDFQACNTWNAGCPNMILGINYQGGDLFAGPEAAMYVLGNIGVKFFVDGGWRDTNSSVAMTSGTFYRLTATQNGADFEGKLTTLDGTVLKDFTYHSSLHSTSTGNAFLRISNFPAAPEAGTPAFDNFSLTIVPEPNTLVLICTGVMGLLAYAWRKRR
jgi:hypothetical protein